MEQDNSLYCKREINQPRLHWNLVLNLTYNIANEAKRAGINPYNLVFTGGIAVYLHTQTTIGNKAVNRWRGTHDVDLIVTEKGGIGKILTGIQQSQKYDFIEPLKSHFPDKQTWKVQSPGRGHLASRDRNVDIDVYFINPETGSVNFNGRHIRPYPENFITSQVTKLSIGGGLRKSEVAVPSLLDCLITKFDIAAIDGKLRHKDRNDILSLLMACERNGTDAQKIIIAITSSISGSKKIKPVMSELENLFSDVLECFQKRKVDPEMVDFIPSQAYLKRCKETIASIKNTRLN